MLSKLFISNYALIDELEVKFDKGLTIITGETGAGKSIIMGALALILGERANAQAVRDAERKIVVEATFSIAGFGLKSFFTVNDIDYDDECLLRREVGSNGRSRAFINDTPVQLAVMKELATQLIDIHSQHSNMLLSRPAFQIDILDAIAGSQSVLEQYSTAFRTMKQTEQELNKMRESVNRSRAEEDYVRFQFSQLQELQLQPREDEELEAKQARLANATSLKEQLWSIISLIDNEEHSALDSLKQAVTKISSTEPLLSELEGMSERASTAIIELKDIVDTISSVQDSLMDDPRELERIEERLNAIYSLEHKHNVDSVDALLDLQHEYEKQLSAIDNSEESIHELESRLKSQQEHALKLAGQLSAMRKKSAKSFESQLTALAAQLGLKNLNFVVEFSPSELNIHGCDTVEFMMAFNKNQLPMPVRDTASGGEISRVMLCIKAIVARCMNLPTIIFDEVDTGVSGDTASMIGELMGTIAESIQVIAITHLPQVASHANVHMKVFKTDLNDSTVTNVKCLNDDEHVMEIARMLGGRELDKAAIENAKSLIRQNK